MNQNHITILVGLFLIGVVVVTNRPLPETFILPVPFTVQATNGNWDRNEDCEEASIAMANAYLNGNRNDQLPAVVAQEYINSLKHWEELNIGYNDDTGADATSRMAEGTFGISVKQIKDYTERDLKKALLAGHVVLLPINARLLGNATYAQSGPFYHMIVVRGYNSSGFIVNDPGTERGNGMLYSFKTLKKSAADWDNPNQTMDSKTKIALILSK